MKLPPILVLVLACVMLPQQPRGAQKGLPLVLSGTVTDKTGAGIETVDIYLDNHYSGTSTNKAGEYRLRLPDLSIGTHTVIFSRIGYDTQHIQLSHTAQDSQQVLNLSMQQDSNFVQGVNIMATKQLNQANERISVKYAQGISSAFGSSIEAVLKTLSGVSASNEMSNQYRVRGGNADENLLYINGIRLRKHQFIGKGQQEGLSLINPEMVGRIEFNKAAYGAVYGGRMSSVLDVKYRTPKKFRASASISLLNAQAHLEGVALGQKLSYSVGLRSRQSTYLFETLEEKGRYNPLQQDLQTLIGFQLHPNLKLGLYGNYSSNVFSFYPKSQTTKFGTLSSQNTLKVQFSGQEQDEFLNTLTTIFADWKVSSSKKLYANLGFNNIYEQEHFDISSLQQLTSSAAGGANQSEVNMVRSYARNKLNNNLLSTRVQFFNQLKSSSLKLGVEAEVNRFQSRIDQWQHTDSVGKFDTYKYNFVHKALAEFENFHTAAFVSYKLHHPIFKKAQIGYNLGFRNEYYSFNQENLLLPRAAVFFRPEAKYHNRYSLSAGVYNQSNLYKLARRPNGTYNTNIRSPKAYVVDFSAESPFLFLGNRIDMQVAAFYKHISDLVRYRVNNLLIQYQGENTGNGFARGLDLRLSGEFADGANSWLSMAITDAQEDFSDDQQGYLPSLSNQLFTLNMFYEDYLPLYPSFRVNLSLNYGTRLAQDNPNTQKRDVTISPFFRVDLGFSKVFSYRNSWLEELRLRLDVLNLFDRRNVASFLWVAGKQRSFAVPNNLTPRSLNLSLQVRFH